MVINARIDALVTVLDAERDRLQLTNGELVVFNTVMLAGLLDDADRVMLTEVIGFVLAYVSKRENAHELLDRLKQVCEVEEIRMPES